MTEPKPQYQVAIPQSEADFLASVIEFAHARGWLIHHCRPGRRKAGTWNTPIQGDPGFPDLVLARNRRIVIAELKGIDVRGRRGKLSTGQAAWFLTLSTLRLNSEVYVWWPDSPWQEALR